MLRKQNFQNRVSQKIHKIPKRRESRGARGERMQTSCRVSLQVTHEYMYLEDGPATLRSSIFDNPVDLMQGYFLNNVFRSRILPSCIFLQLLCNRCDESQCSMSCP